MEGRIPTYSRRFGASQHLSPTKCLHLAALEKRITLLMITAVQESTGQTTGLFISRLLLILSRWNTSGTRGDIRKGRGDHRPGLPRRERSTSRTSCLRRVWEKTEVEVQLELKVWGGRRCRSRVERTPSAIMLEVQCVYATKQYRAERNLVIQ